MRVWGSSYLRWSHICSHTALVRLSLVIKIKYETMCWALVEFEVHERIQFAHSATENHDHLNQHWVAHELNNHHYKQNYPNSFACI